MAYEQKEQQGILFKNDRKNSEKSPDYTGQAKIEGVDYLMSAWIKEGKQSKFMSFSFTPRNELDQRTEHSESDDASDLPF